MLIILVCPGTYGRGQGTEEKRVSKFRSEDGPGDDGFGFVSQTVGKNLDFIIRRHERKKAEIVMSDGGKRCTMPDERILEPDNEGWPGGKHQTILEPGQTFKGYDFYPSPDRRWLFVRRGGFRRFAVCYLYKRVNSARMEPVHPGGLRLDDSAIRKMALAWGWSVEKLRGGARNADFLEWDTARHRLRFGVNAASGWYPENKDAKKKGVIRASGTFYFDLKTSQLGIEELDKDYTNYVD